MDLYIWEGQLVVEGIPKYESFVDVAEFLGSKSTTWLKPIRYESESNLSYFYLLTDLSGREHRFKSSPTEDDIVHDYITFVESLFDGVVELTKAEIKIDAPCLTEIKMEYRRPFGRAKETLVTNKEEFLSILGINDNQSTEGSLGEALAELDSMIGLTEVKRQIHDLVSIVQNKGKENLPCLHMIFTGNPGTGKTEVARILGKVLAGLGVISSNKFVEVDRSDLVAKYVGHTAVQTKKIIESALGGVLFIDEAYSLGLYKQGFGAGLDGGERHDFGPEAIDMLVKQIEDHRNEFVCIMAGYPKEMETMVRVNPGLKDRVAFMVDFPDYDADELTLIFEKMIHGMGYQLSSDAIDTVAEAAPIFAGVNDSTFGNARFMRKLAERAVFRQNVRSSDNVIEACDVSLALNESDFSKVFNDATKPAVGFSVA